MDTTEFFAFIVSLGFSIFIILLVVALGWFCVWKFFLSRFRFVRELISGINESSIASPKAEGSDSEKVKPVGTRGRKPRKEL